MRGRWAWAGLAAVLVGGLALRLWGVRQGLPYVYNIDEADHFVPQAVEMFQKGAEPALLRQPAGASRTCCTSCSPSPTGAARRRARVRAAPRARVYTLARVAAAVLGTAALWLLYATGARLFDRAVGLLAAAIEAVAFLPVFYAHLALNDAPTLAPADALAARQRRGPAGEAVRATTRSRVSGWGWPARASTPPGS